MGGIISGGILGGAFSSPQQSGAGSTAGNQGMTSQQYSQLYQQLQQSQQLFGVQNIFMRQQPVVAYEPMYPIAIKHIATGKRLVVWEE